MNDTYLEDGSVHATKLRSDLQVGGYMTVVERGWDG